MQLQSKITFQNMQKLKRLYLNTFPLCERKPWGLIRQKCRQGFMEVLCIEDDAGAFLGLAIMILYKNIALLDYFAIAPECRGQGIGAEVLQALRQKYTDRTLLLEIENPDVPADNTAERVRRKAFYLRQGMQMMPYRVMLFGVEMHILTFDRAVEFSEYRAIFEEVFSPAAAKKVTLIQ